VRRLVVLIVLALLGAGLYGWTSSTSAVSVAGSQVSDSTFLAELSAISSTPALQCYLDALSHTVVGPGAGAATASASSAATWANLRIEGISVANYVSTTFHYIPTRRRSPSQDSLEAELTEAASSAQYSCPGTSARPSRRCPRDAQRADPWTSDVDVLGEQAEHHDSAHARVAQDVLQGSRLSVRHDCISIALVAPAQVSAFSAAEAKGESVAALAKQFSSDASAKKAVPTGASRPRARPLTACAPTWDRETRHFRLHAQYVSQSGSEFALFVAPTRRPRQPFDNAASAVLSTSSR